MILLHFYYNSITALLQHPPSNGNSITGKGCEISILLQVYYKTPNPNNNNVHLPRSRLQHPSRCPHTRGPVCNDEDLRRVGKSATPTPWQR